MEGFGLPLVEAMQRGLPAMGSDIAVFREIGGEFMAYFDLAEPKAWLIWSLVSRTAVNSRPLATSWTGAGSAGVKPVRNWLNAPCAILSTCRSCKRGNMRIALNARILQAPRTGIGHYVAELANALASEPDVELALFHGWGWSSVLPEAAMPGYSRLTPLLRQIPGAYQARRWLEQKRFDQGRAQAIDLYHEPSLWPLSFDGPTVITLHDLTHLHYPETQPPARLREIERRVTDGVRQASLILTDSQFIADEAQAHFGLPAERFVVAPLGVAARFHPRFPEAIDAVLKTHGVEAREYFLCVGTWNRARTCPSPCAPTRDCRNQSVSVFHC